MKKNSSDGVIAGAGCLGLLVIWGLSLAWIGFLVWAIYKIVMWITAQEI